jgi:hypothetical protein
MKRLLAVYILLWHLFAYPVFGALPAALVWEVRATVGSNNNGGGFVAGATGTDFSQQDAAQYTFTNLASTSGTTNPCVVTSASHNFVAADVGNLLHVTAGTNWIANFFQIVSVAANAATLDRACGTAASISNGTFAVGGALASMATAVLATGRVAGNKFFLKATGNYTVTASLALNTSQTPSSTAMPNRIIGYTTTRTDKGRASIVLSTTAGVTVFNGTGITGWYLENLDINCATLGTSTGVALGDNSLFINGKIRNCTTTLLTFTNSNFENVLDSEFTGCTAACGAAVTMGGSTAMIARSWIHDNASPGLAAIQRAQILFNVFSNNTGASSDCISGVNDGANVFNNTFFNCGRDGIRITTDDLVDQINIRNNIFVNVVGNAITGGANPGSPALPAYDGNAFFNNGANRVNMDDTGAVNPINAVAPYTNVLDKVLTATPFVNAAGDNYQLNTSAGGGALLRGTATPGPIPGLTGTGKLDFGALQAQSTQATAVAQ